MDYLTLVRQLLMPDGDSAPGTTWSTPELQELAGYNSNLRPQQYNRPPSVPLLGGFGQTRMAPPWQFQPDVQFDPSAVTDLRTASWPWVQMQPQNWNPYLR